MMGFVSCCLIVTAVYSFRASSPQNDNGERLARTYCQSCHVLPAPSDLDKATWVSKVFPMMRRYMGLDPLPQHNTLPHDLQAFYPTSPSMTEDEWFAIAQWYIDRAPAELPPPPPVTVRGVTNVFQATPIKNAAVVPMTTFVKFDSAAQRVLIGDGMRNQLHVAAADGTVSASITLKGPPSSVAAHSGRWYVTDMGKLLPHDSAIGSLVEVTWSDQTPSTRVVIDSLRRPTDVQCADLNGDRIVDYVVCEYGNLLGQFGWYEILDGGRTVYHQLSPLPGAIRAIVHDVNGDSRPDIIVQMAQARESIVVYTNQGRGKFTSREILTFPPSRGSSSIRLYNVDADPQLELVYTAGDNGDYDMPPYKPYHGVYIFDQSKDGWKQTFFQRMDGAYGAWVADFTGDAQLDLFSYSYFPRFDRGDYDLVRFDQDVLQRNATSWRVAGASLGRWLVSDMADIDADGDLDIILGNVSIGPGIVPDEQATSWTSSGVLALILRNTAR